MQRGDAGEVDNVLEALYSITKEPIDSQRLAEKMRLCQLCATRKMTGILQCRLIKGSVAVVMA